MKKEIMEQNRRDREKQRQVKRKVQQTLRGTALTKTQKNKKYPNKEGYNETKPTLELKVMMTPRVKRKKQNAARKKYQLH